MYVGGFAEQSEPIKRLDYSTHSIHFYPDNHRGDYFALVVKGSATNRIPAFAGMTSFAALRLRVMSQYPLLLGEGWGEVFC